MMTDADDAVGHKIRRAAAANALRRISGIVAQERRTDLARARCSSWMLRYGIASLLLLTAVAAYFLGVF